MCSLWGGWPGLISQTRPRSDSLFFHLLCPLPAWPSLPFRTCSQISSSLSPCLFHSRSDPPFPFLHFHQSSLGKQIAFSVLCSCGGTAGNNGRVGLVVVATGMRQGRGGKEAWGWRQRRRKAAWGRASAEGMLVVSRAAGKRAPANYTCFHAHRN